uniref:DUF4430 domain-containing protein n=1 Tax=Caenorhabditis tropicalis TaxID=1561998 RepID=A0A1I7UFX1_9PELO
MERNSFPKIPIGTIGRIGGWYFTMRRKIDVETLYGPFIITSSSKPAIKFRVTFDIAIKNGEPPLPQVYPTWAGPIHGPTGSQFTVDDYLDERNGYLTNGGFIVEYGFQIEGILSPDDIWTFNYYD